MIEDKDKDKDNKVVIVIENKVLADEGETQIPEYEKAIKDHSEYNDNGWKKYFIFLTPDGADVKNEEREETWFKATYQMIYEIIENILEKKHQDIPDEARMILESYNDLLIKENIVMNNQLEELCTKIWSNQKYRDALDILRENRPDNKKHISEIILDFLDDKFKIGTLINGEHKKGKNAVKNRQNAKNGGHIFRFTTEETRELDVAFYLGFWKEGFYLQFDEINQDLLENYKKKESRSIQKF